MSSFSLFSQEQIEEYKKNGVPQSYIDGLQQQYEQSMKDKTNYSVYQQHPIGYAPLDLHYPSG